MILKMPDDLRQAVKAEGTPLKLVDPQTGETYLLCRETEDAHASSQVSNAQLLEIAKKNRPPQEWVEGEEEKLF